ncbi:MAG: AraC family transcriptional regulator [Sphaerochaetaceae bacterium]|nr:AraC family transcriptional regulator [Sphaerochaetaceae bacterium]
MLEIVDKFCWEKYNKTITYDMHKIEGLRNFAHWNLPRASSPVPLHHHPNIIEFHCLTKGRRVFHLEEKTYIITGNEMFFSLPYEPHYTSSNDLSPCSFFGFQIDVTQKDELLGLNREYSLALYQMLTSLNYRHLKFSLNEKQFLRLAFENICENTVSSRMLGVQYLSSFLFKIPDFIPIINEVKRINDPHIKRVIHHINEHYSENLQLKELSAISGYSLSRFKIKFKEVVGIPPANYITFKKLEYAKELLEQTSEAITQIALDAGFSSSNYFCTVFKNFTNYTPSEYRDAYLRNTDRHT